MKTIKHIFIVIILSMISISSAYAAQVGSPAAQHQYLGFNWDNNIP